MEFIYTLVLATTAVFSPSGVELERVADNSVNPPGLVGPFFIEVFPPVPCGNVVLFNGGGDGRLTAYLASPAGIQVIANAGTPVPDSDQTFQDARQQDCAGSQIVFLGSETGPPNRRRSVYTWTRGGKIAPIVEKGIAIGDDVVHSFNGLAGNEHGVAMVAALVPPTTQGLVIKPFDGEPFIVADSTTVLPGQTNPAIGYLLPVLIGSDLAFFAGTLGGDVGIYRWSEGQGISIIVDSQTPVPLPGSGNFVTFYQIASLDYGVVFDAGYFGGLGIFVESGGQVRPLVVPGDTTADGETITAAFFPSGEGSLLSFSGRTAERPKQAVYVRTADGSLRRILGIGDTIEGILVDRINNGADRTTVAMRIQPFGSETQVIYRARFASTVEVPALSKSGTAAMFLGLALIGLWVLHGRRTALGAGR